MQNRTLVIPKIGFLLPEVNSAPAVELRHAGVAKQLNWTGVRAHGMHCRAAICADKKQSPSNPATVPGS